MKIRKWILPALLACCLGLSACSDTAGVRQDCVCTLNFAVYRVYIRHQNGQPVDSLNAQTVNRATGRAYVFAQPWQSGGTTSEKGVYIVLTDQVVKDLDVLPGRFLFSAYAGTSLIANQEYSFNTDDCKCHINKTAGPDTITVR